MEIKQLDFHIDSCYFYTSIVLYLSLFNSVTDFTLVTVKGEVNTARNAQR